MSATITNGLKAAHKAIAPAVLWQRCQFHLQQNARADGSKLDHRAEIAEAVRSVFTSTGRPVAGQRW